MGSHVSEGRAPAVPPRMLENEENEKRLRDRYVLDTPLVPARDSLEATLVDIWAEVLHFDRIGVHDDFLELEGDSLLAMQVAARIHDRFGVRVTMRTVLDTLTIAALASAVRTLQPGERAR